MTKANDIALKEAQERAHANYVEMVKSHVLDYASAHPVFRLSELWEQRKASPLNEMGWEKLKSFLNEHGYEMKLITDCLITKKRRGR